MLYSAFFSFFFKFVNNLAGVFKLVAQVNVLFWYVVATDLVLVYQAGHTVNCRI